MTVHLIHFIAVPAVFLMAYLYVRHVDATKPLEKTGEESWKEIQLADCEKRMAGVLSRMRLPLSTMSWSRLQKPSRANLFTVFLPIFAVGFSLLIMGPTFHTAGTADSPVNKWTITGGILTVIACVLGAILEDRDRRRQRLQGYFRDATMRAFLLQGMGRTQEAIAAQEETLRIVPDWDMGWFTLSRLLAENGRFDDSIAAIHHIPDEPDTSFWLRTGELSIHLQKGDFATARALAGYLPDRFPEEPAPHLFSAALHLRDGDEEGALALAEKALGMDESNGYFWLDDDGALRDLATFLQAKGLYEPDTDEDEDAG